MTTPTRVDRAEFRRAVSLFTSGVTVVTTRSRGADHAMTANSFTSVSLEPPLALICVRRTARFHAAVLDSGLWSVSVLGSDQENAARFFALSGRSIEGQFEGWPHHCGSTNGIPVLSSAIAGLDCRTVAVHDGGDHSIIVGEVREVTASEVDCDPLVFFNSGYRRITP